MSSLCFRHLLVCVLFAFGPLGFAQDNGDPCARAGSVDPEANRCLQVFCRAQNVCAKASVKAQRDSDARGLSAKAATQDKTEINNTSQVEKKVMLQAAQDFQIGRQTCEQVKPDCVAKEKCNVSRVRNPGEQKAVLEGQKTCQDNISETIKNLSGKENAMNGGAAQSGEVGGNSKGSGGNSSGAGAPPASPNSSDQAASSSSASPAAPMSQSTPDTKSADATTSKQSDPCQGANAKLYVQCKNALADRCASSSSTGAGFATSDPACASTSAKTASTPSSTCARFQQQCAKDAQGCLKSMSVADRAKIQSECLGGTSDATTPAFKQGTAGFGTASVSGGGSGSSPGTSSGATLYDLKTLKDLSEADGHREGAKDNLRVDAGGGYSSPAGGGSAGGGEASLGDFERSKPKPRPMSMPDRAPASSNSDVDQRFGPNLFSIQSSVLKARCTQGRLLHCAPELKSTGRVE